MTARRLAGCALALAVAACGKKEDPAQQRAAQGDRVIPVSVAKVEQKDFPVFLDGLGTVTAFYTVTVRSQVDGRLEDVIFREGQEVKKGEVLAQIDPRPFQIQLHQGEGALARDQAQLLGAKRNLQRFEDLAKRKLIAVQQADDQRAPPSRQRSSTWPTRGSPRRSMASPASAMSIPAISSARRTSTASSPSRNWIRSR
jgi:multidrug efflux system membrane fusion protein